MLIYIVGFLISFLACVIGRVCGLGGGVIIKPTLDAFHMMDVTSISFLSSCTVLAMTAYSVYNAIRKKEVEMDMRVSTFLAIGSCVGGILGKSLFGKVKMVLSNGEMIGMIQAVLMLAMLMISLLYTLNRSKIKSFHLSNPAASAVIGGLLGLFSAFIGGGSGPMNMAVLFFFFTMSTKLAAVNSLYIILVSQAASLVQTFFSGSIRTVEFNPILFVGMVCFALIGTQVGRKVNQKISEERVNQLFIVLLVVLICVNVRNAIMYLK